MNEDEKFRIHVQISGLRMPLDVPRSKEHIYRKAGELVNKYLINYQKKYNQRKAEEIILLVAYQLAIIICENEFVQDETPLADKIKDLDKEIERLLSEK